MARSVLLAITGTPYEAELLARLAEAPGRLTVVRRCLDLAELLSCAEIGLATVALVDSRLRRLDREAVTRLHGAGVTVIGVLAAGAEADEATLADWGAPWVLPSTASTDEVVRLVDAALLGLPAAAQLLVPVVVAHEGLAGQLIAVWGPAGAPGRTTVALTLADELAFHGAETLLVDADTYGPSLAQGLGLLDEGSGIAAAARAANAGILGVEALAAHARQVRPGFRLLTGLSRPDRWPELPAASLGRVLASARELAEWSVVDTGFCLEQDELADDTGAPRRNGATTTSVAAADVVLLVTSADPVSLGRLIRAWPEVRALSPAAQHRVVVNRFRPGAVGRQPGDQLVDLLARHGLPAQPLLIPYDREANDLAVRRGKTLREAAPKSPARLAVSALAESLIGARVP